ncbi:DNA-binding response regulator, OmpR family, contains REC and winged-helix (wHTH) domain [Paenibacillus sophorae]|uniref:DNA-binding response regulator, OmpR family, contains REC and winged-helix (WHTH) domain n=1 Tax=Paenibacillus sophorae TaxID=1333845 RepID=A0A1H8RUY3_9BACL|nr:response regulator transcription factor [Paenibacillus sophorae]QWU16973.1 response regulator transcription factor [Paenibacillus sophorae]SEO69984.1 DNA-binding response regulator, OmpR family, contains REC and winged-helix (wHTH) domain [Paenibacillus sophorae]
MYNIMLVEDSIEIRTELSNVLIKEGYKVTALTEFINLPELILSTQPNLLLLDINLPGVDGFTLCTEIRRSSNVPIIFVTSRNSEIDELMSITLGGDDFITKPYNIAVLLARIAALLKRAYSQTASGDVVKHGGVELHLLSSRMEYDSKSIELTKNELKILHYLMIKKGTIVSRSDIIEHLWDSEMFVDDNTLSVNITRIRNKLESLGITNYIQTKRGQGYMV